MRHGPEEASNPASGDGDPSRIMIYRVDQVSEMIDYLEYPEGTWKLRLKTASG